MGKTIKIIFVTILFVFFTFIEVFAEEYNVKVPKIGIKYDWNEKESKAVVTKVLPGFGADKAGVQVNDRIQIYPAVPITKKEFINARLDLPIGKNVETLIYRGDKLIKVSIEVGFINYKAYYNNNLKKKKLRLEDFSPNTLQGSYSDGLAKYLHILNNFVKEVLAVQNLKKDHNSSCEDILNVFYIIYDRSKKSNKRLYKDIYSLVNMTFYKYLSNWVEALNKPQYKHLLEKESGQNLIYFMEQIFSSYYLPNYSEIPGLQATYSQIKLFSAKIAGEKQTILAGIQQKHQKSKGGWKFLKWGMTTKDVKILLNKHNDNLEKGYAEPVVLNFTDNDSIRTDLVIKYSDKNGPLYFYKGKLMGRLVDMNFNEYIENHEYIVKSLKEKYPKGKIYKKEGPGYGTFYYHHFKLKTNDLEILTTLAPPGYAGGGIYYYNPKAIKNIRSEINQQYKKTTQDKRKKLKDKF